MTTPTRDDYIAPEIVRALDELASLVPATMAREVMVRGRLEALAHRAFEHGRAAAIHELLTTQQMAAILGITDSHVRRLAKRHDVGWLVGRDRLYRPEDVERLREIRADNPPMRTWESHR